MRKIRLLTTMLLLASTLSTVLTVEPVQASPSVRHFSRLLWTAQIAGVGPRVHDGHFIIPATSFSSGNLFSVYLVNKCLIRGDYDLQVNYKLTVWPSANGIRLSVGSGGGYAERASVSATDVTSQGEYYNYALTTGVGQVQFTSTTDLSGSLRVTRVAGVYTTYYLSGLTWVAINSFAWSNIDTGFAIGVYGRDSSFAHQEVKVTLHDFIINSGTLVCP
jgi:hypothetical protein